MTKRWGQPADWQNFVRQQEAVFVCGRPGCGFRFRGKLDDWLEIRDQHRAKAHPDFKPRKRRLRGKKVILSS